MNTISPSHMNKLQSSVNSFFGQDMSFDVMGHVSNTSSDYYIVYAGGYRLDIFIVINSYIASYREL